MTIEHSGHNKTALRSAMRQRLRSCTQDRSELSSALGAILLELKQPKRIAIFSPLEGEPDLTPLMPTMPQHEWLFPRVDGGNLHFHRVEDLAQLRPGAFGIQEPDAQLPITAIADIDIFICPGLAFDAGGGRLGRGRGFYDRVLSKAREDALKIGVGFACQVVEDALMEAHDIPMNAVLCKG